MDFLKTASEALFGQRSEPTEEAPQLDELKITKFVRGKLDEARKNNSRLAFESTTVTNTAYLLGYDAVYYDARQKLFVSNNGLAGSGGRGRVHTNLVLPSVQNRTARLCKNPPRFDVRPNSPAEDDKEAARLSLKVLLNVMDRERYNEKRIENTMWMQQAGIGWIKVSWDPDKGKNLPFINDQGKEDMEREGDIAVTVESPLEIFVDPLAKRADDMGWLIQAKVRPLSYFRNRYPEKGMQVKSEDAWLQSIQNVLKIQNMTNKGDGGPNQEQMKNSAIEIAYYEKPTKKFPKGRLIISANNVLLAYKPLPIDEIPFVKFDDVKVGGKFHSESLITHLRPLQDQMNRISRRKSDFINKCLNAKIIAAKGHGMTEESVNDRTEVLEYNNVPGAEAPKAMQMPQMPQYAFQEDQQLKGVFSEIIGIGEASKGQAPSAQMPAIGMQLLVEQDDTRIGVVVESNENSHADVGRLILKFAGSFYNQPRMLKELGRDGDYNFTEVTGEMLKDSYDVCVIRGSTLPGSKTLRRQDLFNLYQNGVLGDPNDPALKSKVLESMEFGEMANLWEDLAVDRQQVDRSIDQIESGQQPEISPDDNHQMHYEVKNRLRKSVKFEQYAPEIKQIFMQDFTVHKNYIMPPPPQVDPMTGQALAPVPTELQDQVPAPPVPAQEMPPTPEIPTDVETPTTPPQGSV